MPGGRPKGLPKTGGGSRKGIPNKATKALKDAILEALEGAGGVEYLKAQAITNSSAFLSLVGKTLPLQMQGDKDNPIEVVIRGLKLDLATKLDRLAKSDEA